MPIELSERLVATGAILLATTAALVLWAPYADRAPRPLRTTTSVLSTIAVLFIIAAVWV